MALAVTITSIEPVGPDVRLLFKITASGSYTTGGDTLDFTGATQDALFVGPVAAVPSSLPPKYLHIGSGGGQITYFYTPKIGTTQANCKVLVTTASNTQISATTYPAGVTGDTINGEAVFTKNI